MIKKQETLLIGTIAIVVIALWFVTNARAASLPMLGNLFANVQIEVTPSPALSPTAVPTPMWTITQKIQEALTLLSAAKPGVFGDPVSYTEQRFASTDGRVTMSAKTFKEPEKEIALGVLNTETGEVKRIFIRKRGADLIAPTGWSIDVLQRPSGIRWNGWNTAYRINTPANHVVIANVYPDEKDTAVKQKNKNGKVVYVTQRTVAYRIYSPYGPDMHNLGLAEIGEKYTDTVVAEALASLKATGVASRALNGQLVADVFADKAQFFARIPLLEQTDLTEFQLDPMSTIERAQVIIGANGARAFNATCNSSSACGWVQFTPGTYNTIVKMYPAAKLIKDFKSGAADHLNSMKAAILLYDENLKGLITAHGTKMLNDPNLEEYLASSYNGAPRHVYTTLKAAIIGGIHDWVNALTSKTGGLKIETKGYLVKLRWLNENIAPSLTSKTLN